MIEFLKAGGIGMVFVLLFGLLTLAAAIGFAVRAELRRLALVRAMTSAAVFSIITAVLTDFLAVMRTLAGRYAEFSSKSEVPAVLMQGLGESVTPAILGFAILAIAWVIVAVGTRRVQDHGE
jgi:hypothetical protein